MYGFLHIINTFYECLMRNNNNAIFHRNFNYLKFHRFANECIIDHININLRIGEECLNSKYINSHASFRTTLNTTLNCLIIGKSLKNTFPRFNL